jgi:hypothetical protein
MKNFIQHTSFGIKWTSILLGLVFLFLIQEMQAQVISNNGAFVSISGGAVISTGTINNDNTATLSNEGTVTIASINNNGTTLGNGTYNIAGNFTNTGTFSGGTSTVNMNGISAQTITMAGASFYNLIINNGANVTLNSSQNITNDLSIFSGALLNLNTFTHSANLLSMGGIARSSGSWGHTSSPAANANTLFFENATGIVNVTTSICNIPTISIGTNPVVYSGITAANLSYSATTNSPNQYSVNFDAAANLAGFVDVSNINLPASPIVLTVPAGALSAIYHAILSVRNATTGCVSSNMAITVTVIGTTTWTVTAGVGSWSNGMPNAGIEAIISGNYSETVDLTALSLTVNNGAVVSVPTGFDFNIAGSVIVQTGSSLTFQNNANLIQSGTTNVNTGNITSKRINSSMRRLDYTYWSAPTASATYSLKNFSSQTVSPPVGASRFYQLNETTILAPPIILNGFSAVDPLTTFFNTTNIAKGFSIRAPNNFPTNGSTSTFNADFIGVPNNGDITIPVTYTSGGGKGVNLIGNPYPSAIDALAFLNYSPDGITQPNAGTIYFWAHKTQGGITGSNYASFNKLGGTAATAATAVAGIEDFIPNGTIQVGQGFLLKKAAAATVVFNNSMRVGNNLGQFYKTATTIEKHRIWLNLANETTPLNQMLVGYIEGATLGFDDAYDGKLMPSGSSISSLISSDNYVIQARPTPFENTDEVALGFKAETAGSYTLSIDHVDGLFLGDQNIYLKDNLLSVTQDIKTSAYTFTSEQGTFNDRFEVVYTNATLGMPTPTFDANAVIIYKNDNKVLSINAGKVVMKSVKIYDVRGRLIYEQSNINTTDIALNNLKAEQEVLLIKITSDDNKTVTKKVVF